MEERTLTFDNIPMIRFLFGAQRLDGPGNKISYDRIDGNPPPAINIPVCPVARKLAMIHVSSSPVL